MRKNVVISLVVAMLTACAQQPESRTVEGIVLDAYDQTVMIQSADSVCSWVEIVEATDMSECYDLVAGQSIVADCHIRESATGEQLTALKIKAPAKPYEHYIVGAWVDKSSKVPDQISGFRLASDGSATSINTNQVVYTRWELRGNRLVLICESDDEEQSFEQQLIYLIKGISDTTLILESEDGSSFMIYSRQ